MVSDWQAGFGLQERDDGTLVTARSTFEPKNLLVRLTTPVMRRKFRQTQQAILAGLKHAIEGTEVEMLANRS